MFIFITLITFTISITPSVVLSKHAECMVDAMIHGIKLILTPKQSKKSGASTHTMYGDPPINPSFQNYHSLMLLKVSTER